MKNYYHILGLNRTASRREIRRKTYDLGKQFHPKKSKLKELDAPNFIDVIEAYTVLYDDETREIYHWLLDHDSGKKQLREPAIPSHRKIVEIASYRGIGHGREYTKQPFWIFRDDLKSTGWWNIFAIIPN